MGSGCNISGAFSSDTTISTPVAINKGGTGETTAQAALDALAAASGSLVQGDIFIVDASGNVVRLARGSDNQTLVMNGSNPNWETASGGATTISNSISDFTNSQTTTSTSYVAVAGGTAITQSGSSGICIVTGLMTGENSTAGNQVMFIVSDDGNAVGKGSINRVSADDSYMTVPIAYEMDNNASAIDVMWKLGGTTGLLTNGSSFGCLCTVSEIS